MDSDQVRNNMATLEDATTALAAWDIQPHGMLKEIHPQRVFKVYQKTGDDLILKDVSNQSPERLAFEFDVLQHLATKEIPVAVPLKAANNQQAVSIQGTHYTLSPCLLAEDAAEPGAWEDRIPSYGELFARLHLALASYPNTELAETTWSSDPIKESFDVCVPNLLSSLKADQATKLSEIIHSIESDMRSALADLSIQLIHRDLHDGNLLCSGDQVVGIIDCDHVSFGNPMIDIAYFLHHTIKWIQEADGTMVNNEGGTNWWFSWMPNLFRAYNEIRPLSTRDRESLPYMMIWVILKFADMYYNQENHEETQLYLNLLDFVYVNRDELAQ
jgi:Ser/Thr protein kinase RdoA (MazF antagonist)